MRVALVGSRTISVNPHVAARIIEGICPDVTEIVSGGCPKGADAQARTVAALLRAKYTEFPADWDTHGKIAGFLRNSTIVDNSDLIVAYHDGISRGTQDTINKARKQKKFVVVIMPGEQQ